MKIILIMLLAVITTAGSLLSTARMKTKDIYSDKFFSYGSFTYNDGNILFVKHLHNLNYVTRDTVMFEYSRDMRTMDTVFAYHSTERCALIDIGVNDGFYYFYTGNAIARVDKTDKNVKVYENPVEVNGRSIEAGKSIFMINHSPSSYDMEHFWIQEAYRIQGNEVKPVKRDPLRLPPVIGFSMMHVQPRQAVTVFGDTIAVADPCFENIYYYDFTGKLLNSFRIDSLLGFAGSCGKFKTFRQDKDVPQRNFDQLMDMNTEGRILRSINNYKGKLLVRVATSYSECDTYVIDLRSLKWEKLFFGNEAGAFGAENIPLDNFTVIDGDYIINTIQSDIKGMDLSRFANYGEFVKYTEENRNTGTSYLVREIIFE